MEPKTLLHPDEWQSLLRLFPGNLEETAKQAGLLKRKRQIRDAESLLRIILAYCWLNLSFRNTAAWAAHSEIANISDVAILKQIRKAAGWLQSLVMGVLRERSNLAQLQTGAFSVQIMDSSVVNEPGSKGTDWRTHTKIDLASLNLTYVEVTDSKGAESLTRYPQQQNQINIADRGFAHREGIAYVVESGAHVIVRINWKNVPLSHPDGSPFDVVAALQSVGKGCYGDWSVRTTPNAKTNTHSTEGRLVAIAKSEEATQAARSDIRKKAKRNGVTPDARTLRAAGYVFVFTSVAQEVLSAAQVLELYRFRWQIELVFKRMKSLLGLSELHAHDPALCKTFLYSKFLAALLIEDLSSRSAFSPWTPGPKTSRVAMALDPVDVAGVLQRDRYLTSNTL